MPNPREGGLIGGFNRKSPDTSGGDVCGGLRCLSGSWWEFRLSFAFLPERRNGDDEEAMPIREKCRPRGRWQSILSVLQT